MVGRWLIGLFGRSVGNSPVGLVSESVGESLVRLDGRSVGDSPVGLVGRDVPELVVEVTGGPKSLLQFPAAEATPSCAEVPFGGAGEKELYFIAHILF